MIEALTDLTTKLSLLYSDTRAEEDDTVPDREFIGHCTALTDYLVHIGAIRDDNKTFRRTELGQILIDQTQDPLPWLEGFVQGMEMFQ